MKKTIITLLALAGVAMAADEEMQQITLTATFNADITATSNLGDFKIEDLDLYKTADSTTKLTSMGASDNDIMPERLRPNTNVDSAAANSWTLDFSISNDGENDLTITSITLNAFAFNGGGDVQPNSRNFLFTVKSGNTVLAEDENLYIAGGSTSGEILTLNLTDALTIFADDTVEFSIKVAQGAEGSGGRGSFLGLNTVSFNGAMPIPEPTTATLSLLALAGLAARRRRK